MNEQDNFAAERIQDLAMLMALRFNIPEERALNALMTAVIAYADTFPGPFSEPLNLQVQEFRRAAKPVINALRKTYRL